MIDSHCHLDFKEFNDYRDEALQKAKEAGVHTIINVGCDLGTSRRSLELAREHEMIHAVIGVHPHDAKTLDDDVLVEIEKMTDSDRVVAIGEIGLDYYRDLSPRKIQQTAFRRQLELAVDLKMPVVIHTRDAFEDTMNIITGYAKDLPGILFHCFQEDTASAYRVFDIGGIISAGGIITYKNSRMSKVAEEVPIEKVILETDAPYLTPVPFRGKTNQPAYVKYVYEKMAELKEMTFTEVEKIVDRTALKFYRLIETFGD